MIRKKRLCKYRLHPSNYEYNTFNDFEYFNIDDVLKNLNIEPTDSSRLIIEYLISNSKPVVNFTFIINIYKFIEIQELQLMYDV